MNELPLFVAMAAATIASPGPGVVYTLNNAIVYGGLKAFAGLLGIAAGALITGSVSASGLGVLVTASPTAFAALRYLGAAYLLYLGVQLWRSAARASALALSGEAVREVPSNNALNFFARGATLQFTNPKSLLFFMSILPQFIDPRANYVVQVAEMILIYAFLVVVIHGVYTQLTNYARPWLGSPKMPGIVKRTSGACFLFFGVALASRSV